MGYGNCVLQSDEASLLQDGGALVRERYRVGGEFGLIGEYVKHDLC